MKKAKEPIKLRMKQLKNGNQSLYLDFYLHGKRRYEYLNLYIIPEKTKFDKERNRVTMLQAESVKAKRIIEYQNGVYGVVNDSRFNTVTLSGYIEHLVNSSNIKENTKQTYNVTKARVLEFGDIPIVRINRKWLIDFIRYLSSSNNMKYKEEKHQIKGNTISLYINKVGHALRCAMRDGIISSNPMEHLYSDDKPKHTAADKCFLTIEEVMKIRNAEIAEKLKSTRDAFLFCCFTGLRLSDVRELKWSDIADKDGSMFIEMKMVKTGKPISIPLSSNAIEFIPDRIPGSPDSSRVFYELKTMCVCEDHLEEIAKAAKISKHITFHASRHTAATLWLTYGADLYTVSKLLGHTNIQSTQVYAKVVDELKEKAVSLVPELKKKDDPASQQDHPGNI